MKPETPHSPFTIRSFAPRLLDRLADAFAAMPYDKPRAQYERYLAEHVASSRATLVALAGDGDDGDAVIGYVNLLWRSDYSHFADASVPEINDLNVRVEWRRRGVASALIAAAESTARAAGCRRIGIGVGATPDYDAARRLYPALGYAYDGHGPHRTAYGDSEYLTKALVPDETP
jgi:GNAT superfamily N-acetyltransferase